MSSFCFAFCLVVNVNIAGKLNLVKQEKYPCKSSHFCLQENIQSSFTIILKISERNCKKKNQQILKSHWWLNPVFIHGWGEGGPSFTVTTGMAARHLF